MHRQRMRLIAAHITVVCTIVAGNGLKAQDKPSSPERWEAAIKKFEEQDSF